MDKYTFSRPERASLSLRRLCDILIHSQEFLVGQNPDRTFTITFNSDRTANKLYHCPLRSLLNIAQDVGNDDVVYLEGRRDLKTGEMITVVKSRKQRLGRLTSL